MKRKSLVLCLQELVSDSRSKQRYWGHLLATFFPDIPSNPVFPFWANSTKYTFYLIFLPEILCTTTRLQARRFWVRVSVGATDLSHFRQVQTGCGAHPAFCSVSNGTVSRGLSIRSRNLKTRFHLAPKLRLSGVAHLRPLYVFVT